MKNLKYVLVCLLLIFGVNSMSAQKDIKLQNKQFQSERGQKLHQEKRHKLMQEELSLTDDQMKKIEMIRAKRAEKIQKLEEQISSLKEEQHKEIQEILTPEQREKSEKLREKMRDGNRRNHQMKQQKKKNIKMKRLDR